MKFLITLTVAASLLFTQKMIAQKTIIATVVNATSDTGKIHFALYNKSNFMQKPLKFAVAIIKDGKSIAVFKNVPEGEYAITCFHDKNNNKRRGNAYKRALS